MMLERLNESVLSRRTPTTAVPRGTQLSAMRQFRAAFGGAVATASVVSGLNSADRLTQNGAALPLSSSTLSSTLDASTTTSWHGPSSADGTPTQLYSLSLGRVWHNHTENAELTAMVDAKKAARRSYQGRRSLHLTMEDTPLFPGWGTHFAYVYAGTPPQRVSVIVDTGSHFTAFPCSECRNCGSHTDPYWDHTKSSSSHIVSCSKCHGSFRCNKSKRCGFSQRYSEGSSWSAYQVEDVLWVGELTLQESEKLTHDESAYAVEFMFGCIESQTGLFKTQLADGIMGMSADKHTLVWQLAEAGKIKERIFSLCFSLRGGTMVLGGYDARLNKPGVEMQYTPSTKDSGWFTVKVTEILLDGVSIAHDSSVYQKGKGTIVDSGTTDTYLPKSVAVGFSKAWEKATGQPYKPCMDNQFCMRLTPSELDALPTLYIRLDGDVEVKVRPQAYMDALGKDNAYAPRIYMEESMGAVLGANVMRDHNVVFDFDNHRVGFAEGMCDYKPAQAEDKDKDIKPALSGEVKSGGGVSGQEADVDCVTAKEQVTACDAACPLGLSAARTVVGREKWVDVIVTPAQGSGEACPEELVEEIRECAKECPKGAPSPMAQEGESRESEEGKREEEKGDEEQPEVPKQEITLGDGDVDVIHVTQGVSCSVDEEVWTECSTECLQERYMSPDCVKEAEARPCHVGNLCPTSKMGLILSMGLALTLDITEEGDEGVKELAGDRKAVWMDWVGIMVSDTVASQLSEVPPGDVEASVAIINPEVIGQGEDGKASLACTAEVIVHLTPKVDNNAANRASSALNIPALPEILTASLKEAQRNGAHGLQVGFRVAFVSAERASMFIASNGEAYLPPVNDRMQAAYPRRRRQTITIGTYTVIASLAFVVAGIYAVRARLKQLQLRETSREYEAVSQVEMQGRGSDLSGTLEVGEGRSQRKQAGLVRDGT